MENWKLFITEKGHLRKMVMTGMVREFIYKVGGPEKMRSIPRMGSVVEIALNASEQRSLERLGMEREFRVRISGARIEEAEGDGTWRMWLSVDPEKVVEGGVDVLTDGYWEEKR